MFWVVNTNLHRQADYDLIVSALKAQDVDYVMVRKDEHSLALDTEFSTSGPVFVLGQASMRFVAQERGWTPGYIEAPEYDALLRHW